MFFRRNRPVIIIIALLIVLLAALIITVGVNRQKQAKTENLAGNVISSVYNGADSASQGAGGFFARLFGRDNTAEENVQLKQRVIQLETENQKLSDVKAENERLKTLLGYTEKYPEYEFAFAEVIARDVDAWQDIFVINAGKNSGIAKDMAVVTADGLAGRVIEAGDNWARVMTVISSENAVSVVVERSREIGIIRGADTYLDGTALCNLYYLPSNTDIVPGDRILTSNQVGVYPNGIAVGEVVEVNIKASTQTYAVLKPYVDFDEIEEVMVIVGGNSDTYEELGEDQ